MFRCDGDHGRGVCGNCDGDRGDHDGCDDRGGFLVHILHHTHNHVLANGVTLHHLEDSETIFSIKKFSHSES